MGGFDGEVGAGLLWGHGKAEKNKEGYRVGEETPICGHYDALNSP